MRRNGKISKLSIELREELNVRLEAGQEGKELVKWLNSLPEVKDRMRFGFRGKPISEQNLSQWKKGGYLEWQEKEERRHMLHQLREEFEEMEHIADPEETQRHLSVMLTLELARAVQEIKENTPDLKERLARLEPVIGKFAQLRREESNARRVEMQWKLHRCELGEGVGGFGVERALERMESELQEESRACVAAGKANSQEKSVDSGGAKKESGKKREASKGKSRPNTPARRRRSQDAAEKAGSSQAKASESGQSSGEGQGAKAGQVAEVSPSQGGAGEAKQPGQSDPGESKSIKVDQSGGMSVGKCGETKGLDADERLNVKKTAQSEPSSREAEESCGELNSAESE